MSTGRDTAHSGGAADSRDQRTAHGAAPILLTNAILYDGERFVADGAVLVAAGRIAAAGPRAEVEAAPLAVRDVASGTGAQPAARGLASGAGAQTTAQGGAAQGGAAKAPRRVDCGGRMLLPGLLNAHHHLYSALAAGLAPAGPMGTFPQILENLWWRLDAAHDHESIYYSTVVGLLDAVAQGCTTVIDHHASMGQVTGSLATMARAFREVGVRGVLCFETSERSGLPAVGDHLAENVEFAESVRDDEMLAGMLGLHANITLSRETLQRITRERPAGLPIHVHVGEAPEDLAFCREDGFAGPVARLDEFGLVERESFLIHGIHLDEADRGVIERVEPVIVTNPQSNANNGVGRFDPAITRRYLLGSDGMTNDMIATLRYHYLALQEGRRGINRLGDTFFGYAREVRERFFPGTGALRPGARADLVVLEYAPVTPITAENALMHLIFGARGARARLTMVDGRVLFEEGAWRTVDAEAIAREVRGAAARLHARFYG